MAILAVGGLTAAVGVAALAVDLGVAYLRHQELQGATDLAALAAARVLDRPAEVARVVLADNSFPDAVLLGLTRGRYAPDSELAPGERFIPDATPANAVRLRVQTSVPSFFAKALTGQDGLTVSVESTAATTRMAAFSIGSRLTGLQGGAINGLLGAMLGTTVSLSIMDYQALARAEVDLFGFLDRLATHLSLTAVSYDRVLDAEVSVGTLVDLMISELSASPASADGNSALLALEHLHGRIPAGLPDVRLGEVIQLGPAGGLPSGSGGPAGLDARLPAFDLLRVTAMLANLERQVDIELDLNLPYLVSAEARLVIGEPMQGTGWVTVGDAGASVHTAQTRLHLDVQLMQNLTTLGLAEIRLPVYIELARGEATLERIDCDADNNRVVTVDARGGVAEAWIGEFAGNWLSARPGDPVSSEPALLVRTPLAAVTGEAHVALSAPDGTALYFSHADIERLQLKSTHAHGMVGNLARTLVSGISLDVDVLGLGLLSLGGTRSIARDALAAAAAAVDPAIDALLATLGVRLGEVDVIVSGADCRGAVLVN